MIPVNEPLLDGNEERYLTECVRTGWISSEGPFIGKFEEGFAARVGRAHGIVVSNGSAALDVAVAALGLGPDDEVIVPPAPRRSCGRGRGRFSLIATAIPGIPTQTGSPSASPREPRRS